MYTQWCWKDYILYFTGGLRNRGMSSLRNRKMQTEIRWTRQGNGFEMEIRKHNRCVGTSRRGEKRRENTRKETAAMRIEFRATNTSRQDCLTCAMKTVGWRSILNAKKDKSARGSVLRAEKIDGQPFFNGLWRIGFFLRRMGWEYFASQPNHDHPRFSHVRFAVFVCVFLRVSY